MKISAAVASGVRQYTLIRAHVRKVGAREVLVKKWNGLVRGVHHEGRQQAKRVRLAIEAVLRIDETVATAMAAQQSGQGYDPKQERDNRHVRKKNFLVWEDILDVLDVRDVPFCHSLGLFFIH